MIPAGGLRMRRTKLIPTLLLAAALLPLPPAAAAEAAPAAAPPPPPETRRAADELARTSLKLAGALSAQGRMEEAVEILGAAVEAAPESGVVHAALGDAYAGLGTEAALILAAIRYREALRLDPALDTARLGLARASYRAGRVDEGIRHLEALLAKGGTARAEYAGELAMYYLLDGRARQGIAALEKALAQDPAANPVRVVLAVLHRQVGEGARAAALLREAIGREPAGSDLRTYAEGLLAKATR